MILKIACISGAKGLVALARDIRAGITLVRYVRNQLFAHNVGRGQAALFTGRGGVREEKYCVSAPFFSSASIFSSSGEGRDTRRPDTRRRNAIPRGNLRFYRKFIRGAGLACEPDEEIG